MRLAKIKQRRVKPGHKCVKMIGWKQGGFDMASKGLFLQISIPVILLMIVMMSWGADVRAAELAGTAGKMPPSILVKGALGLGDNFIVLKGSVHSLTGGFHEGLSVYTDAYSQKYGYVDLNGNIRVPLKYSWAEPFSEGLAYVNNSVSGLSTGNSGGYIDTAGHYVIPPSFDEGGPFIAGKAIVSINGKYRIINPKGESLLPQDYVRMQYFPAQGYYLGQYYKEHKAFSDIYDRQLKLIRTYECNIQKIISLDGRVLAFYNIWPEGSGVMDLNTGQDIIPLTKDANFEELYGFIHMSVSHDWLTVGGPVTYATTEKIYDSSGKLLLDIGDVEGIEQIYPLSPDAFYVGAYVGTIFTHGYDLVPKRYFVTKQGKQEVSPSIVVDELLAPGLLRFTASKDSAKEKFTSGVFDQQGSILIPADYEQIFSVRQQWIVAKQDSRLFIFNLKGEVRRQYSDVAKVYPGDSGFAYQDLAGRLHIVDQDLQETGCAYLPGLTSFSQVDNLYQVSVSGENYLIIDKRSLR